MQLFHHRATLGLWPEHHLLLVVSWSYPFAYMLPSSRALLWDILYCFLCKDSFHRENILKLFGSEHGKKKINLVLLPWPWLVGAFSNENIFHFIHPYSFWQTTFSLQLLCLEKRCSCSFRFIPHFLKFWDHLIVFFFLFKTRQFSACYCLSPIWVASARFL